MQSSPALIDSGPALDAAGLAHRVQQPKGSGPHPTVIMIHGRSGSEDSMWVFSRTLPRGWLAVVPRAPRRDPDGGYSWLLRTDEQWPTLTQFDEPVGRLMRFIGALPGLYQADLDRVYLMGFSQGAALAYAAGLRYPGRFRGIAGLVGFVPAQCGDVTRMAPLANLPVFMAVGKEDALIPYERSVACAQTLQVAGCDLEYHEYDTGHKLNQDGMADLKAWWADRARGNT